MASVNLPVQLTSFIGRERDLSAVKDLLATARLVTLTGVGGAGKTRLAIQVATVMGETFADGVWLVDLAPLHEPDLVLQLVAQTLRLRPSTDQPLLEIVLSFVQSKQLLLILDNCEHLREACAQLALELLSHSSDLRILTTSREPLAVTGETIHLVSGLAWPSENVELGNNPKDWLQYDSVRLFVERARAISPNFNLTLENASPIIQICQHLDGLPLALELASARVNVLTVQEIAARLSDRFDLLFSTQRIGLDPRHHTLRAAIDWSHALLTIQEQVLLMRLAVFASGCTLDTAEAVCAGEGIETGAILELLSSLVDKSLVIAETAGRTQARYRLLETIREYAFEKLDASGEAARLRDRHLCLFLERAEEGASKLGGTYQPLWLNWLDDDHENLRAALAWALESKKGSMQEIFRIEAGLRIASALQYYWGIRGSLQEGLEWFKRLLARADDRISPTVRVNAIVYASFLAMYLGDGKLSLQYGHEAVTLAEAAGDEGKEVLAFALAGLASGEKTAGDYPAAFSTGERVLQLYRESGPPLSLGMALISQGDIAFHMGNYRIARERWSESLSVAQKDQDTFRIAYSLNYLGDLARAEQNYSEAASKYKDSEALLRELNAHHYLASIFSNLGFTLLHLGEIKPAQDLFNESMAIYRTEQNNFGMIDNLVGLGAVAIKVGLPAAGVRLLAAAEAVSGLSTASTWPATQLEFKRYLDLARAKLTNSDFQAEQAAGRGMSIEQAIDYALNLSPKMEPDNKITSNYLTNRELEIVALIAQGKTNNEIAQDLVLSRRTVEKHAANILSKLGLTSRTQIVRWAMERDLRRISQ